MKPKSITVSIASLLLLVASLQGSAQNADHSKSINAYSFDLYESLIQEGENLLLSPLSTYYALLMLQEGARGQTKKEFEKVLHLRSGDNINPSYLRESIVSDGLQVHNAIWLDNNFSVKPEYESAVMEKYSSEFRQTNFSNPGSAIREINQWVSGNTNGKIKEIVNEGQVQPSTRLLLANSIYFEGEWQKKFCKKLTKSLTFYASSEDQYKVDFMTRLEELPYYESDDFRFISKSYKDSNLSFCALLPKRRFGLEAIEAELNDDLLKILLENAIATKTSITIPKVKLEGAMELSEVLKEAGLHSAFTSEADFSGISENSLFLEDVIHKTWIEIDEEKTEAAAATAVVMIGSAMPKNIKVFRADHPFIFFIIDNSTQTILFMGRYVKPVHGEKIPISAVELAENLESRKKGKQQVDKEDLDVLYVLDERIITKEEFSCIDVDSIDDITITLTQEVIQRYTEEYFDKMIMIRSKK